MFRTASGWVRGAALALTSELSHRMGRKSFSQRDLDSPTWGSGIAQVGSPTKINLVREACLSAPSQEATGTIGVNHLSGVH